MDGEMRRWPPTGSSARTCRRRTRPIPTSASRSANSRRAASKLQAGLRLDRHWRLQGNIALVAARYDKFIQNVAGTAVSLAGNRPTSIPARVANVWLTWDADASWSASLESPLRRRSLCRYGQYPALRCLHACWGASVSYKIDPRNTLTLRGRNLNDTIYFASGSTQVRIGEPRAFELACRAVSEADRHAR
jgi:iron complex outermembrane receptor protein